MTATLLRGAPVAQRIIEQLTGEVADLAAHGVVPCLASVQVGDNDASRIYRAQQEKKATALGIAYRQLNLAEETGEEEIAEQLRALNGDPRVHGIILQTPLPADCPWTPCRRSSPRKRTWTA